MNSSHDSSLVILTDMFAGLPKITDLADNGLMLVDLLWGVMGLPAAVLA